MKCNLLSIMLISCFVSRLDYSKYFLKYAAFSNLLKKFPQACSFHKSPEVCNIPFLPQELDFAVN